MTIYSNLKMVTNSKEYIKTYKNKQFKENPQYWNAMNRKYRAKKYYNLTKEDMDKYDLALPLVGKAWKVLDQIQKEYPYIMDEVLAKYMVN